MVINQRTTRKRAGACAQDFRGLSGHTACGAPTAMPRLHRESAGPLPKIAGRCCSAQRPPTLQKEPYGSAGNLTWESGCAPDQTGRQPGRENSRHLQNRRVDWVDVNPNPTATRAYCTHFASHQTDRLVLLRRFPPGGTQFISTSSSHRHTQAGKWKPRRTYRIVFL